MRELVNAANSVERILLVICKNLEKNGSEYLSSTELIEPTKLRPRELLGLSVVSSVAAYINDMNFTHSDDPRGRDGLVLLRDKGIGVALEQVFATRKSGATNFQDEVIRVFRKKKSKGKEYAKGHNLVILTDMFGNLDVMTMKNELEDSHFESVWIIGMIDPYHYQAWWMYNKGTPQVEGIYYIDVNSASGEVSVRVD